MEMLCAMKGLSSPPTGPRAHPERETSELELVLMREKASDSTRRGRRVGGA